jgi:hypothetical protein
VAEDERLSTEESSASRAPTRRKPSTGFPVVSLAEAATILKNASKYGFEQSVAEFASHMGHTTTNSGAFRQRLAAFRDWKLITGRGDHISMTDIGRVIALPPDRVTEQDALRDAFKSCTVFNRLYDDSLKNKPLDRQGVGRRAVHAFGVSPKTVNKFIDSFVESAVVAGFAEELADGQVRLVEPGDLSNVAASAPAEPPLSAVGSPAATRSLSPTRSTPWVHHALPIDGGMIVFEIHSEWPLPASAYATVGEVVASLERLQATLAPAQADGGRHSMEAQ